MTISTNISFYLRNGYSYICSETICKHRILFPSIQHLAWLPQGRPQGKQKCGKIAIFELTHWLKHRITRKVLKTDRFTQRGVWQALNCLSIHAARCVIIAGASPGETKMWAAIRENGDFFCTCGTNNLKRRAVSLRQVSFLFKVMQQQNIGEVRNSIIHLWKDNFCMQQWKNFKIGQYLRKLCRNEKGSSFLTHSVGCY